LCFPLSFWDLDLGESNTNDVFVLPILRVAGLCRDTDRISCVPYGTEYPVHEHTYLLTSQRKVVAQVAGHTSYS
jgi:hypothetical protein